MIIRLVKIILEPENGIAFKELFEQVRHEIGNFEGCTRLDLLEDIRLPNVFFTYSEWESEIALENYRKSPLFAGIWEKTKVMFSKKAEAWSTQRVD
jgi:quinol monooxygenase YgiN